MSEKYDFVFVGGGHNALTCAGYLAKAGQSVIVLERRDLVGGGVMTEEFTLPGFKHNDHSCMHEWIHVGPVYKDLELEKYGSKYVGYPELLGRCANVWEDGSSLIWWQDPERFAKDIEYFSKKDAKTFLDLYYHWLSMGPLVSGLLFNHPIPPHELEANMYGTPEGKELMWLMRTSTEHALLNYFESDKLISLLGIMITQLGTNWDSLGTGSMLPAMTSASHHMKLAVGGSKTLADAMCRYIEAHKGVVKNNSEVKEIVVKNGVAHGVKLSNGDEYLADKAVVCNVGPTLIFGDGKMVGDVHLSEDFLRQAKRWRAGDIALFTPHFALEQEPLWKAAEKNPDINKCWDICICEDSFNLRAQVADVRRRTLPRGEGLNCFMVVMPTKSDPTQAPNGKHTAFIWVYCPFELHEYGGPEGWDKVKKEYGDEVQVEWAKYAPNMGTKEAVLMRYDDTPYDISIRNPSMIGGDFSGGAVEQDQMGVFRPFHGVPSYKTPIENLYMCGPSCHPGGGCSGAPGYIATSVICDDFKIKKWWKPFTPETTPPKF